MAQLVGDDWLFGLGKIWNDTSKNLGWNNAVDALTGTTAKKYATYAVIAGGVALVGYGAYKVIQKKNPAYYAGQIGQIAQGYLNAKN